MSLNATAKDGLLVDGHVHFHRCYDEARFLQAAHDNLRKHGKGTPVLLLTESNGDHVYRKWRSGDCAWAVTKTEEVESLVLGGKMLVMAGRQVNTAERVEVLALLTSQLFADGQPLEQSLAEIKQAGAIPLLPWGVGKWIGSRGRLVADSARRHGALLGDNAGRPFGWPAPELFKTHVVLPGTDPLCFPCEQTKAGTYGFTLNGVFDLRKPGYEMRSAIRELAASPEPVGRRAGIPCFLRQQVGIRLKRT